MKALHSINPSCIPISTDSLRPWYTVTPIQKLIPIPIRHRNTTLKSLQCSLKQEQNITPSEANFHTRNKEKIPNHQTSRHEDYTDYDTEEGEEEEEKDDGRGVVIGPHGVGYKVPGAPFEFQYSYTETPKVKPLKLRENYLPFGPTTMERPWTGKAPLPPSKKKRREFDSFKPPPPNKKGVKSVQPPGPFRPGDKPKYVRSREEILGEPLTSDEVKELLDSCKRSHRQLHIGRDGLTHNMLENIHHHWKRRRVCKIRCLGVATVDMDNICEKLEEKTGGKIIHRHGGILYLFRGRNYNYKTRQVFPLMLWRPMTPVYPKLIQKTPAGLTENEAIELRRKGRLVPPICALGRNGVYHNLVSDIRDAFEVCELVRIDCTKLKPSDFKRIAGKLKDTVPCVLLSFSDQHILLWRGKNWVSLHERIELSTEEITYQVSDNESENMTAISNSDIITTTDDILDKNIKESVRISATLTVTENNIFSTENVTAETISTMSEQHAALRNFDSSVQDEKTDCKFGSSEEENEVIKMAAINNHEESLDGCPSSSTRACSDEEFSQQNVQHFSNARGLEKQHPQDGVVVAETDHYQSGLARLLSIGLEANIPDNCSAGIVDNDSTSLSDAGYEGPKNRISADHMVDRKNENESVASIEAKNEQEKTVNSELEALWDQAIDSGRLLLLNELDLDPDTILEKVAAFAKNAPPDPVFEPPPKPKFVPNMNKRRKELRKILFDGTKDVQETTESGKDSGGLPLDELARLLLQS